MHISRCSILNEQLFTTLLRLVHREDFDEPAAAWLPGRQRRREQLFIQLGFSLLRVGVCPNRRLLATYATVRNLISGGSNEA